LTYLLEVTVSVWIFNFDIDGNLLRYRLLQEMEIRESFDKRITWLL
jgi:hypothetical protein